MAHILSRKKYVQTPTVFKWFYSFNNLRYIHEMSASNIRKQFLDYFVKENDHKFVRSSPVVPFCDPSVAFVNAGMNQFKNIFLGKQDAAFSKVTNYQKCIRVGGKHNDINIVGSDGYHHTFFEMLGNWSFGDYFKREACELAWNLLTGPYNLKPSRLYVTYFSGDPKMMLEPDLECRDIWRSLGIADDHIIPFGVTDNFWEMGNIGPCGPCTEIHIDHINGQNRSKDVNKNLPDLTELWNIVFIEYNRNVDGSIDLLPKKHIDTGMGFERLTAILQRKESNYDTDIFSYLFKAIQKTCIGLPTYGGNFSKTNELDTAYRILADHSRMITVCLADGMIPEQNQKLRRILRKCLHLSETIFKQGKGLLTELAFAIAENLENVYPEIQKNIKSVHEIISFEEEIYKSIRKSAVKEWSLLLSEEPRLKELNCIEMPGLISAYKDLINLKTATIDPQTAFRLYDTHGLDEETIAKISNVLNLPFESEELKKELSSAKQKSKESLAIENNLRKLTDNFLISKTKDIAKYDYESKNGVYKFKTLDVKVLHIVKDHETLQEDEIYLILDQTNLYTEAGGQISDIGYIKFASDNVFTINKTLKVNGYIFHQSKINPHAITKIGDKGTLNIDEKVRLSTMANHTATHLLNAALKKVLQSVTCQKSSFVSEDCLYVDMGIYGEKLTMDSIYKIECLIRDIINKAIIVKTKLVNSQDLLSLENVTMIPGEVYPDNDIRLVHIDTEDLGLRSCEPCCGTHVLNTSDIQDFCITNFRSLGRSTVSLTAVTRDLASQAHENGRQLLAQVSKIHGKTARNSNQVRDTEDVIAELRHQLIHGSENSLIPAYIRSECIYMLNEQSKQLRLMERKFLQDYVDTEMKIIIKSNINKTKNDKFFVVHYLGCSSTLDNVPLQRATKACNNIPVLVLSYSENMVKARCCVPEKSVSNNFNAELWLKETVASIFKGSYNAPKGQNAALVCNMKPKKINEKDWDILLKEALNSAKKFANNYL